MAPGAIVTPPPAEPIKPLKRSSSQLETDSAPTKRMRGVKFSDTSQYKRNDEQDIGQDPLVIGEEIRRALQQHDEGNTEEYERIKGVFEVHNTYKDDDGSISAEQLRSHVVALTNCATLLRKTYSDLVYAALNTHWLIQDDNFINKFTRLLGALVTSHGGWIGPVLGMLVKNFAHVSSSAGTPKDRRTAGQRRRYMARVHSAIKYVLQIVPSANVTLSSVMASTFPYPTDSKKAHVEYVRNILRVTEYAPELSGDILDLVTDRVIKIDVEIQIEIDDLEEDVEQVLEDTGLAGSSQQPADPDDVSDAESTISEEDLDEEEQRFHDIKSAVEKLDAILDQLFDFHNVVQSKSSRSDSMFQGLISQFTRLILPAHRSRHTQFLLFHFAQLDPELSFEFASHCIGMLTDKTYAPVVRRSAAAYLASFIARGAKLDYELVGYVFQSLADHLNQLRQQNEQSCRGPDMRKYSVYYATAQALVYIFCFRWRDLLAEPEEYEGEDDEDLLDGRELTWLPKVKEVFSQNFYSKLNPLKVCAPEVVEEFAKIAHRLRFLYVFQIIEANKRIKLSQTARSLTAGTSPAVRESSLSTIQGERQHQLEDYFPFDPYRLPVSKRWLEGEYNEYKGVPGQEEVLDSSEDTGRLDVEDDVMDDIGSDTSVDE